MDIDLLKNQLTAALAGPLTPETVEQLRITYLGRKGVFAELTAAIPQMPQNERPQFGKKVNELKRWFAEQLDEKVRVAAAPSDTCRVRTREDADIGMPGIAHEVGTRHIITQTLDDLCGIFLRMGFEIAEGPEVETEANNFTGLNIPLDHPSRDAFDTFYLDLPATDQGKYVLRSHTSPVQVRVMSRRTPPLAVVVPGRVYRPDAVDASHSCMFHQIEGFVVDDDIRFSDLKGVLEAFARAYFGESIRMRFRPHFFPFTEPSAEMDISCIMCSGKGCSVCGRKGWLEVLGAGMIHPNVLRNVGYPAGAYTGFAFGMGVDRIAMLKHGITDIRLFYENDVRFLQQFQRI
jgi:phenylalanyl-tRNA synthetase alpha chain